MKIIYGTAFGIATFFAMNCGSGDGYGGGSSPAPPAQEQPQTSEPATPSAAPKIVNVEGHDFDPPEVHIKVGETVRWVWVSGSHNVVSGSSCSPDGNFTSGASSQGPGSHFDHAFDAKGTFPYYCDPHCGLGMVGKVVVE